MSLSFFPQAEMLLPVFMLWYWRILFHLSFTYIHRIKCLSVSLSYIHEKFLSFFLSLSLSPVPSPYATKQTASHHLRLCVSTSACSLISSTASNFVSLVHVCCSVIKINLNFFLYITLRFNYGYFISIHCNNVVTITPYRHIQTAITWTFIMQPHRKCNFELKNWRL